METRLTFWPQGTRKPFVFVHVEGVESESHTGRKGKARVGLESKFNKQEAKKAVSCNVEEGTSLDCIIKTCVQAEIAAVLVNQHKVSQASITALTPYSAQKEELKKRLQEKRLLDVPVKTITESQGDDLNNCDQGHIDNIPIGWFEVPLLPLGSLCLAVALCRD